MGPDLDGEGQQHQRLGSLSAAGELQGFSLCLSADCESHLTGLALSSPARMRGGPSRTSLLSRLKHAVQTKGRGKYKDNGGEKKAIRVRPFWFLRDIHFQRAGRAFKAKVVGRLILLHKAQFLLRSIMCCAEIKASLFSLYCKLDLF